MSDEIYTRVENSGLTPEQVSDIVEMIVEAEIYYRKSWDYIDGISDTDETREGKK